MCHYGDDDSSVGEENDENDGKEADVVVSDETQFWRFSAENLWRQKSTLTTLRQFMTTSEKFVITGQTGKSINT